MLHRLEAIGALLPESVPEVQAGDPIGGWGHDGPAAVVSTGLSPDDFSYDTEGLVNEMLHLVWDIKDDAYTSLIRRGEGGLTGYARILRYFIEVRGCAAAFIGPRMEKLWKAAESL